VIVTSQRLNQRFLCLHAIRMPPCVAFASLETAAADGVFLVFVRGRLRAIL